MNPIQQKMYNNLIEVANENGCKVISLEYKSARDKLEFKCPIGHLRITSAESFKAKPLACKICSGMSSVEAEKNFITNVEKLGGKVIGKYKGKDLPVECICKKGHTCFPYPGRIRSGVGMCIKCAGKCSKLSEQNFIEGIEKLGGKVIGKYTKSNIPVECICPLGHICFPHPSSIQQGGGMCKKCAGNCSLVAEKNFKNKIEILGGKMIGEYEGAHTPLLCICPVGHTCFPTPNSIQQGGGMCKKCAGNCKNDGEKNFNVNITKLGGKVIGEYKSAHIAVECICSNGHISFPHPCSLQQGGRFCKKCANQCPIDSEKNFLENIEKLGGTVIGTYEYSKNKIKCICSKDHICFVRPSYIQTGGGMCKTCTLEQTESKGEKYTSKALDKLGITYTKQYKHPRLPKLRFDFQFEYEEKLFLIEFDGFQHQKYNKYFHRTLEGFDKQRQRDLMKNYLVKNVPECVLIRLDHEWLNMDDPVESLSEYIWEKMDESSGTVVAENLLYMWIFDEPTEESINKYFIS